MNVSMHINIFTFDLISKNCLDHFLEFSNFKVFMPVFRSFIVLFDRIFPTCNP